MNGVVVTRSSLAASLGAAVAVKELIAAGKLHGTVRFYGTPAEEAVGGKLYMIREGLFDDVDVALAWHPADETRADTQSTQALVDFVVEFHGKSAHAAFDPWNGRSALDGLEIFTHALNLMREHVQRIVNEKASTPFAKRNLIKTLRAMFEWAVGEGRMPDNPALGVKRVNVKTAGYKSWSEAEIAAFDTRSS